MSAPDSQSVQQTVAKGVAAWEHEDYGEALESFRAVLKEHPGFPDVRNKAGLCLAMLGDLDAALEEFDRALEINDDYAEAHLNRAIVLNDLGRFEEARQAFARADELDRRHTNFPSDIGNRLAVSHARTGDLYLIADQPEEAAKEFQAALDVRPGYLDIRSKLAEAWIRMGELERAVDALREILEGNPELTGSRLRLGVALHRLGEDEAAVEQWQACLERDPGDIRAKGYLASVGAE